jgi:predicted dienelactone hydrolase
MLMLSHGNTGTPLALHDLATSLARKGFVVVGDSSRRQLQGSQPPRHGEQSVRAADPDFRSDHRHLGDPMLSPFVNVDQVGVIGYSAGGETALILLAPSRISTACAVTARSARKTVTPATPRRADRRPR